VFKEFKVGLLMGLLCGGGVSVIATYLFAGGKYHLGFVVLVAMVAAMTTAAVVGTLAPALMKRLGIDPAIAAGPLVTTANDIIGIVLYMTTAVAFLDQLRG
jgi:magnesium transporter